MELIENIIIPSIIVIFIFLLAYYFEYKNKVKKENNIQEENNTNNINNTNNTQKEDLNTLIKFDDSIKNSLEIFDKLLSTKFEYYLMNDFASYFISEKEIPVTKFKEIKEKYYVDISMSLNPYYLNNIAQIYTKQGIQLYINQTFMALFNKSQIKYQPKNINTRTLNAIIGE